MLDVTKCVFIIVGTIIGAGFASGQEIALFFNRYGEVGLYTNILSSILISIMIFFILMISEKKNIDNYDKVIGNNKFLKIVIYAFLIISFCIMIAGIGAFFEQQLEISHLLGTLIGASICLLIFLYKYKGIEMFNVILVPIIICGILLISVGNYDLSSFQKVEYVLPKFFINNCMLSSILYVSYNSLILIPILVTLKKYNLSNKNKCLVAIISAIIFIIMGIALFKLIDTFFPEILIYELPILKLAEIIGNFAKIAYSFIILSAILTTAISSGYAFLEMKKTNYTLRACILCTISVFLSKIGFSKLINIMFPIFGYLGIIQILIIVYELKKGDTNDKR